MENDWADAKASLPAAQELLPCPECGNDDPSERVTLYGYCSAGNPFTLEKAVAYIECRCFRRTGEYRAKTRDDAIALAHVAWNRAPKAGAKQT